MSCFNNETIDQAKNIAFWLGSKFDSLNLNEPFLKIIVKPNLWIILRTSWKHSQKNYMTARLATQPAPNNYRYDAISESIGFTMSRPAKNIAADIKRRLLINSEELLKNHKDKIQANFQKENKLICKEKALLFSNPYLAKNHDYARTYGRMKFHLKERIINTDHKLYNCVDIGVEISSNNNLMNIKLNNLPEDVAYSFIELFKKHYNDEIQKMICE